MNLLVRINLALPVTAASAARLALLHALLFGAAFVPGLARGADPVRIGYVGGVEPMKAGIADGSYDRALDARIDWRHFDNGAEVVRALAARDLDIGNLGSSVVAVAASQALPIEAFLIASELGTSEGLVARNGSGIRSPADLKGRTVAVPFVSTVHYSLLAALKHWGIPAPSVHIVNMRISEIPAAWQGGQIDAAYVFDPALGRIKEQGSVLATSADVARWGSPTFDVWVVRDDFAEHRPAAVAAFARTALGFIDRFRAAPDRFAADPVLVGLIVRATGASAADVPALLEGNHYPDAAEQLELLGGAFEHALADTAAFLKEQGKVSSLPADFRPYVTTRFIPTHAAGSAARPR